MMYVPRGLSLTLAGRLNVLHLLTTRIAVHRACELRGGRVGGGSARATAGNACDRRLSATSATDMASRLAAFRQGLKESGFVERQNVAIVYRWAHNDHDRLRELASDLARQQVTVIVAGAGTPAALAAKAATSTIPIVFQMSADPIRAGLVTSLSRPGGNITGIAGFTDVLIAKRLELLTELVSSAATFGVLLNGWRHGQGRFAVGVRSYASPGRAT